MYNSSLPLFLFSGKNASRIPLIRMLAASILLLPLLTNYNLLHLTPKAQQTQAGVKLFLPIITNGASGYFVSSSGNDANPGTLGQPWRTLRKAATVTVAGDTVYVRGGIYNEQMWLYRSGTQDKPIHFLAYPGETPVIEGSGVPIPSTGSALLRIEGDWNQVTGFEVRNSNGMGVLLLGKHVTVKGLYTHHNRQNGILINGDDGTVDSCRIWRNSLENENGAKTGGGWSTGLSAARDVNDGITERAVMRGNTVWENWGEGISSFQADHVTIEGNISHDNYSTNIYITDTSNVLVQGNLVYMTRGSALYGHGANVGIMMGDEKYTPATINVQIINNIAYGNRRNFFWWQGSQGGGMVNTLIANNTFVNSDGYSNVIIGQGNHQNSRFINNIVEQNDSFRVIDVNTNLGVSFSNNQWSKQPLSPAVGAGDLVGDARLAKIGQPFSAEWYRLTSLSPAVNHGKLIGEVLFDYFHVRRDSAPDMGAEELVVK